MNDPEAEVDRGSGARLITLLKHIGASDGDCTVKALSSSMGLPASSVHRLLQILVRGGFVERGDGVTYRAGRELFQLSGNVLSKMHYTAAVRPLLRELWETWQETAVFSLYEMAHHRAVVVERLLTSHALRHVLEPYTELSLSWGSLGRSILAHLDPEEAAVAHAKSKAGPITGGSAPSLAALELELVTIRETGCAIFRSEEADVAGIASAVFRSDGRVIGSIGLTMPARRFDRIDSAAMARNVIGAAQRLNATFGFGTGGQRQ